MKNKKLKLLALTMLVVSLLASCGGKEITSNSDGSAQASADEVLSNASQTNTDNNNETTSQSGNVMDDLTFGNLGTETDGKADVYLDRYKGASSVVVVPQPEGKTIRRVLGTAFSMNESIVEVTLPDTVEHIASDAFLFCKNLEKLYLGKGLKEIEKNAFYNCEKLKKIEFGDKLEKIGEKSFFGCESLEEIIIPPSCVDIHEDAFAFMNENFKIKGEKGSYAETFANEHNFTFEEYSFS